MILSKLTIVSIELNAFKDTYFYLSVTISLNITIVTELRSVLRSQMIFLDSNVNKKTTKINLNLNSSKPTLSSITEFGEILLNSENFFLLTLLLIDQKCSKSSFY